MKNRFQNILQKMVALASLALCSCVDITTESDTRLNSSSNSATQAKLSNSLNVVSYSNVDTKNLLEKYPTLSELNVYSPGVFSYTYSRKEIIANNGILSRKDNGKNVFLKITLSSGSVITRRHE